MELHLKHMEEITDQLAAIGAPISEEDQVYDIARKCPINLFSFGYYSVIPYRYICNTQLSWGQLLDNH